MSSTLSFIALCLTAAIPSTGVYAWGTVFESRHIGGDSFTGGGHSVVLKASRGGGSSADQGGSDIEDTNTFADWRSVRSRSRRRRRLEQTTTNEEIREGKTQYDPVNDKLFLDPIIWNENVFGKDENLFESVDPDSDIWESLFSDHNKCEDGGDSQCEDDCLIPEEYKVVAEDCVVDVLSFLGISRAEPLKVVGSWE